MITARPAETIGADRIGFGNLTYYWMQVWMQVGPPHPRLRGIPIWAFKG